MEQANKISCDAMHTLAKANAVANRTIVDYSTVHPVCERFHGNADRKLEHMLQINSESAISRKLCVTKTDLYGMGDWVAMMQPPLPPVKTQFDQWTKSK